MVALMSPGFLPDFCGARTLPVNNSAPFRNKYTVPGIRRNKICRNAKRLGYYTPEYEWCEWDIKDKPIRYLSDDEEQRILKELDPSSVKDPAHKKGRQAAGDIFVTSQ